MVVLYYLFMFVNLVFAGYSIYALYMHYTDKDYFGSEYVNPILEKITFIPERHRLAFLVGISTFLIRLLTSTVSSLMISSQINSTQEKYMKEYNKAMQNFDKIYNK